jgi:hypothetical protein
MNSLTALLFTPSSGFPSDIAVLEKAPIDQNDPNLRTLGRSAESKSLDDFDNSRLTWKPSASYWWITIPLSLAFIAIAISSEVVLFYSRKNSGKVTDSSASDEAHSFSVGFDINLTDTEPARTAQLRMVWLSQFRSAPASPLIKAHQVILVHVYFRHSIYLVLKYL